MKRFGLFLAVLAVAGWWTAMLHRDTPAFLLAGISPERTMVKHDESLVITATVNLADHAGGVTATIQLPPSLTNAVLQSSQPAFCEGLTCTTVLDAHTTWTLTIQTTTDLSWILPCREPYPIRMDVTYDEIVYPVTTDIYPSLFDTPCPPTDTPNEGQK